MKVTYSASVCVASTPVRDAFCICVIQVAAASCVECERFMLSRRPDSGSCQRTRAHHTVPRGARTSSMSAVNRTPSGGRFGLTPQPRAGRTGTTSAGASRAEAAARFLSTPVAPSLVHQRHSFTLTDLPPAWCSSCGCLRESGWVRPASLTARRRESSRWWSVSRHLFLLSKAEVAKRCLPGRMSAKDHNPSCGRTDRPQR
jgi:hypothetical protein